MPVNFFRTDILEAVVDSVPIIIADLTTGEIYFASRPAEELFGYYVRGDMVGHNVDELVPDTVRVRHPEHRAAFEANPQLRPMGVGLQLEGQRRSGRTFPVSIGLSATRIGDKRCVVATIMDMSIPVHQDSFIKKGSIVAPFPGES